MKGKQKRNIQVTQLRTFQNRLMGMLTFLHQSEDSLPWEGGGKVAEASRDTRSERGTVAFVCCH